MSPLLSGSAAREAKLREPMTPWTQSSSWNIPRRCRPSCLLKSWFPNQWFPHNQLLHCSSYPFNRPCLPPESIQVNTQQHMSKARPLFDGVKSRTAGRAGTKTVLPTASNSQFISYWLLPIQHSDPLACDSTNPGGKHRQALLRRTGDSQYS